MPTIAHATIVMERTYPAAPAGVFHAWADAEAKARWSAPTNDVVIKYEEADFREGGRDVVRCIEPNQADYVATVHYLDLRTDKRIVFAEEVSNGKTRVSAALISVELNPVAAGTQLLLTLQIASFDGANMEEGYKFGWAGALDNLAKEFAQ